MNRKTKELNRSNNALDQQISPENREAFTDMICYLRGAKISAYHQELVMENIRLGRSGASDEDVRAAAKAAQCDEFIDRLPQGYDTNIGENGSKLSGGERQRISIARALLKNAPVILLDEATASMDAESETMVQTALSALLKGRTVIVIAHRMRTIANADKIVVLDKGKVTEVGTPSELAKKGGLYAHLVALQQKQQMSSLPT